MGLWDSAAYLLCGMMHRTGSALATRAARHSATIDRSARFLRGGSVSNIARRAERIVVGNGSRIAGQLLVFRNGGVIRIGAWCYLGELSRVWSASEVSIGDRVLISHNVNIHDSDSHSLDAAARHVQFRSIATSGHPNGGESPASRPIVIEDDVWIGFNAIVLKGSRIGARSVIAAGSFVSGSIPADSLYVGTEVKRKLDAGNRR